MATSYNAGSEYKVRKLCKTLKLSSVPLVIPNDVEYDEKTNETKVLKGVKRNQLRVLPKALDLLRSINKPVAVVSIAGPYRSGKSYVISRLMGTSDAFALGHTFDAKTFGIWMGTSVLECDDHVVVLLDTEGVEAVSSDETEDSRILVLTLLLSSYFIYNSCRVPEQSDLQKMNMFTKLAENICLKEGASVSKSRKELINYLPDFLWLLRDVMLEPTDEKGNSMTPTDFLIKRVLSKTGKPTDAIGEAILDFFPKIRCYTLPPPSASKQVVKNIAMHQDKLTPEFNDGIEELVLDLRKSIRPKQQFRTGGYIQGKPYAELVQQYVEQINSPSAIPVMENAWENTIKALNGKTQTHLVEKYNQEMEAKVAAASKGGPLEEGGLLEDGTGDQQNTLFGIHHEIKMKLTAQLQDEVCQYCSVEDGELSQKSIENEFESKIEQREARHVAGSTDSNIMKIEVVGGALLRFVMENKDRSRKYCEKLFNSLYTPVQSKVAQRKLLKYSFDEYRVDITNVREQYNMQAIGPAKWEILEAKEKSLEQEEVQLKEMEGYEAKMAEKDKKLAEEEARIQRDREEMNIQKQIMAQETQALQQSIAKTGEMVMKAMEDMQRESRRREEAQANQIQSLIDARRKEPQELLEQQNKGPDPAVLEMNRLKDEYIRKLEAQKEEAEKKNKEIEQKFMNIDAKAIKAQEEANELERQKWERQKEWEKKSIFGKGWALFKGRK